MREYYIKSINGNINVMECDYLKYPSKVLIYCHGFGGHNQSIDDSLTNFDTASKFFSQSNIHFVGFEFQGHGKSDGEKFYIDNIDDLVIDLMNVINHIISKYNTDTYLYGKSMSCLIILKYLINHYFTIYNTVKQQLIKGIIFVSPMYKISDNLLPSNFILSCAKYTSYIFPKYKYKISENISFTRNINYYNKVKKSEYSFDNNIFLSTIRELLQLTYWLEDIIILPNNSIYNIDIPFIIFQGLDDMIVDPIRSYNISNGFKHKKIYMIPKGDHYLLTLNNINDYIPNKIINEIMRWINYISIYQ